MTKVMANNGQWKPGQSGNPNGRKPKGRALTEMLRLKGDDVVLIGNEPVTAQEALAKAVWQFVTTGEVWLRGKKLEAQTIGEWASVVKWLYLHVEPASRCEAEDEAEIIVRVTREDRIPSPDSPPIPQKFPSSGLTPVAMAGALVPLLAGAAMAFSSIFVVSNSLRLRKKMV